MKVEIGVYLPQVGVAWEALRERARPCDRLDIDAPWFTECIRIGHLVLANERPAPRRIQVGSGAHGPYD